MDKGEGLSQNGNFADKRRGSIFRDFVQASFMEFELNIFAKTGAGVKFYEIGVELQSKLG